MKQESNNQQDLFFLVADLLTARQQCSVFKRRNSSQIGFAGALWLEGALQCYGHLGVAMLECDELAMLDACESLLTRYRILCQVVKVGQMGRGEWSDLVLYGHLVQPKQAIDLIQNIKAAALRVSTC